MLKQRIVNHLERFGVAKTVFCKRVDLSYESLRRYLANEMNFSEETEQRITNYLDKVEYQSQ